MSFSLPPAGHPVRELFDVADVVVMADPDARANVRPIAETLTRVRAFLATTAGVNSVNVFARSEHDALVLIEIGRESSQPLWNFGSLRQFEGA